MSFVGRREVTELPSPPKVGRPPKVRLQEEEDNEAKPKRKRGRPPKSAVDAERPDAILLQEKKKFDTYADVEKSLGEKNLRKEKTRRMKKALRKVRKMTLRSGELSVWLMTGNTASCSCWALWSLRPWPSRARGSMRLLRRHHPHTQYVWVCIFYLFIFY